MSQGLRTALTMTVLLGILVASAYFGWRGVTEGWTDDSTVSADDGPSQACTTPPPERVRSRSVRVSVYNAGAPSGHATKVMRALRRQGFRRGELTDAPERIDVEGIVVWPAGADPGQVELVQRQFRKARVTEPRRRPLGPGINVLVGSRFRSLAADAPRAIEVSPPKECGPAT